MKRILAGLALALTLGGCTTPQITTAHQDAEKALIAADDLYIAIASFANAEEANGQWTIQMGEALKQQAYAALLRARGLYAAGQLVDLTPLTALAQQNGVKEN